MTKIIEVRNWNRREHFEFFLDFDQPFFNICVNCVIDNFLSTLKSKKIPFFLSTLYCVTKTVNLIPELNQRIIDKTKVIQYSLTHPAFTLMTETDNLFTYCLTDYIEDFQKFITETSKVMLEKKKTTGLNLKDEANRNDVIYITSLPWISFTSFQHPFNLYKKKKKNIDSIPRISWGKYYKLDQHYVLPISAQVHHSLCDGIHLSLFFEKLETMFNNDFIALANNL